MHLLRLSRALSAGSSPGFLAAAGCLFSIIRSSQTWNRDIRVNGVAAAEQHWTSEVKWMSESLCCVCVCVFTPPLLRSSRLVWFAGSVALAAARTLSHPQCHHTTLRLFLIGTLSTSAAFPKSYNMDVRICALILPSNHLLSTSPPFRSHTNSRPVNLTVWLSFFLFLFPSLSNLHNFVSGSSNKSWNLRFLSFFLWPTFFVKQAAREVRSA